MLLIPARIIFASSIAPSYLRCEYLVDPLGIDSQSPRLSWELISAERSQAQTAYRIIAAANHDNLKKDNGGLWDTGKVCSDQTVGIPYRGRTLTSGLRVYWKVRTWDKKGAPSAWSSPAMWQMGLLNPSDWKAKWIASPGPLSPAIRDHNGFHSKLSRSPDIEKWVAVDLAREQLIDSLELFPARPFDWSINKPGFLFPARFRVEVSTEEHPSRLKTVVNLTSEDLPNPGTIITTLKFKPVKCRYVRLLVTRSMKRDKDNYGFALAEMKVMAGGKNVAFGGFVTASGSIESGGWAKKYLTDGITTSTKKNASPLPCPMFRKVFGITTRIKHATVFATALGLYELWINGKRVGDHILAPEFTNYFKQVQYQVYDVTPFLRKGKNAICAILGDGWYCGRIGLSQIVPGGPLRGIYGLKPKLRLQLEIESSDGTTQVINSDHSWKVYSDGPIRSSCLLDGEFFDARKAVPGWNLPEFDDALWQPASIINCIATKLVAQSNEPIRIVRELKPIRITKPAAGTFVFDMGQNMVGWCRLKIKEKKGSWIRLRHAEALKPDGMIYRANLRIPPGGGPLGARQEDTFIPRGTGEETFEPHFTCHGFRYVEITGLSGDPPPRCLTGCVITSATDNTGSFKSSDPMLNKLMRNIVWTQTGNMCSMPTDCPQRDERLGWMGDAQTFSQTACFNMDMAAFFSKWIKDIRNDQAQDGRYPDFAPHPYDTDTRFSAAPCWADAGIIIPWRLYINYGDTKILKDHFESAKRWIEYVRNHSPGLLWTKGRGNNYGDWLNGDRIKGKNWPNRGASIPTEILSTAFFAHSTEILSKMAGVLGKGRESEKYSKLAGRIKTAFTKAFVKEDGSIKGNTQAGYALALYFDLVPESYRERMLTRLVNNIKKYNMHASTGIQATCRLMLALTENGMSDIAYKLITDHRFPSWGYMIDNGATTIWERWDGYVKGRGFQDPGMNSFNHYAFGAVGEWIYRTMAGINPDEKHPGYKSFLIHPVPGKSISWVKASYRSIRGLISSEWKVTGKTLNLKVTIPPNTTAVVYVPSSDPMHENITEGGRPATQAKGIRFIKTSADAVLFEVDSGSYSFESRFSPSKRTVKCATYRVLPVTDGGGLSFNLVNFRYRYSIQQAKKHSFSWELEVIKKSSPQDSVLFQLRAATSRYPLSYPIISLPAESLKFLYYRMRFPGTGRAFEYRNVHTGKPLLPRWQDFKKYFIPRAALKSGSKEGFPKTCELLGQVLSLVSVHEEKEMPEWNNLKVLELDPELLVGTGRVVKDKEGERLPQQPGKQNYTFINWTSSDYKEMINAGMNIFGIAPGAREIVQSSPVFYRAGAGGLSFPGDLYRSNFTGPVMYLDEPACTMLRDKTIQTKLQYFSDAAEIITNRVRAQFREHSLRLQKELFHRGINLGNMCIVQQDFATWETRYETSFYQLAGGVAGFVQEGRYQLDKFNEYAKASTGFDRKYSAAEMFRYYFAFLRGAARHFNKSWGISIYGQADPKLNPLALTLTYDMGGRYIWFWTSDHAHHLPWNEQLKLSRILKEHVQKHPRPSIQGPKPILDKVIVIPYGYFLVLESPTGRKECWDLWWIRELDPEGKNKSSKRYRHLMQNAFREVQKSLDAGEEFDFTVDDGKKISGYRQVVRLNFK